MSMKNIQITVVDGGKAGTAGGIAGESEGDKIEGKKKGRDSRLYKVLNWKSTLQQKALKSKLVTKGQMFGIAASVGLAKSAARQIIQFHVSDIGRRHGDSNYQAIVNRRIEQVTDGLGLVGGTMAGAASGAVFGPVGAIVGAVAGLIGGAINIGFRQAGRRREFQHQMFQENNSQAYGLARANFSALTGRVR